MSFPVTEHIAKREHSVILAEDNHTPPISSKSFSKVIENYICLTINRCIPAACSPLVVVHVGFAEVELREQMKQAGGK